MQPKGSFQVWQPWGFGGGLVVLGWTRVTLSKAQVSRRSVGLLDFGWTQDVVQD